MYISLKDVHIQVVQEWLPQCDIGTKRYHPMGVPFVIKLPFPHVRSSYSWDKEVMNVSSNV